jgi:hypothetical protein
LTDRRIEALRRLGGPVCPVCDAVTDTVEVRFLTEDGSAWLGERGKRHVEREHLAPLCQHCYLSMENEIVAKRAAAAQREVQRWTREKAAAEADAARLRSMNGPAYRQACVEYEDDLAAAEGMAASWGVGNGLFGSRGE